MLEDVVNVGDAGTVEVSESSSCVHACARLLECGKGRFSHSPGHATDLWRTSFGLILSMAMFLLAYHCRTWINSVSWLLAGVGVGVGMGVYSSELVHLKLFGRVS